MSKKRLLLCSAALGACAGLAILVPALWPEPPGVTYANFNRVEIGMSQAEVEAILGGPPRDTAPNGKSWFGLHFL
jgi:hypothetical protein